MRSVLFFVWMVCYGIAMAGSPKDSVGIRIIDNRKYIVHKVQPKETWYSISQQYKIPQDSIRSANADKKTLKSGMVILIPAGGPAMGTSPENNKDIADAHANADSRIAEKPTRHTIQPGENINKIAQLYGISVQEIQKWNKLKDGRFETGHRLIVHPSAAVLPYKPVNRNNRSGKTDTVLAQVYDPQLEEVIQQGTALVNPNAVTVRFTLLPEGGVVQLINTENNRQTLVTVDALKPASSEGQEPIIEIPHAVAEKLGSNEKTLSVQIRYFVLTP